MKENITLIDEDVKLDLEDEYQNVSVFIANNCKDVFSMETEQQSHNSIVKRSSEILNPGKSNKSFDCDQCQYKSSSERILQTHTTMHQHKISYDCKYCKHTTN